MNFDVGEATIPPYQQPCGPSRRGGVERGVVFGILPNAKRNCTCWNTRCPQATTMSDSTEQRRPTEQIVRCRIAELVQYTCAVERDGRVHCYPIPRQFRM